MRLTATVRPLDEHRAYRAMVAWTCGDRLALDAVLDEVMEDDIGVPGLLFTLLEFATSLGERVTDDFAAQLRAALLHAQAEGDVT